MNRSAAMTALAAFAALVTVLLLSSSCYVVHERDQIVVTRFSRPVRVIVGDRAGDIEAITKEIADIGQGAVKVSRGPGLYFKVPFVDAPERFPDTLIEYDSEPEYIVTRDKKQLSLDNFARWRIENPLLFRLRVRTVTEALGRLDDIIYSIMREELGKNNFIEIIRTTKEFTDLVEPADADAPEQLGEPVMTERLTHGREEIMNTVTKRVNEVARDQFGIVVVDVRIRRAELLPENLQAVFARMRAERERISKGYVSEGERQGSVIQGETDRDVKIMIAEAEEQAQKLRGEGDAGALRIIAEGFNSNPEFYKFVRGLEAIGKATPPNSEFVIGLDSSLYKMLTQP
jgi:membrane protease subunit HflC